MEDERDLDVFLAAARDVEARPVRFTQLEVLEWSMPSGRRVAAPVPEGTVVAFLAARGAPILDDLRAAARAGEDIPLELVRRLSRRLRRSALRAAGFSPERLGREMPAAAERLRAAPVIVDLRYGSTTLLAHTMIEDPMELYPVVLPYAGGRLAPGGFTLVERYKPDTDVELDAVVLCAAPPLTDAESAALDELSDLERELNVGRGLLVRDDGAVAAAVTFIAAVVVVAAAWEYFAFAEAVAATDAAAADALYAGPIVAAADDHLAEREVEAQGPAATVRRLVDARREALRSYHR